MLARETNQPTNPSTTPPTSFLNPRLNPVVPSPSYGGATFLLPRKNNRFCPVSLCEDHFHANPSGIVAETHDSLQRRCHNPFPRSHPTRGGGSRGGRGARGRGRGGRGRGRGKSSSPSRAKETAESSGGGDPSEVPIAARRPKRGVSAMSSPGGDGSALKRSRGSGGPGGGGGGAGAAGDGDGLGEREFVCRGCKMAARRAVRQYGLLGSLETGGIVLPHGESDVSGGDGGRTHLLFCFVCVVFLVSLVGCWLAWLAGCVSILRYDTAYVDFF